MTGNPQFSISLSTEPRRVLMISKPWEVSKSFKIFINYKLVNSLGGYESSLEISLLISRIITSNWALSPWKSLQIYRASAQITSNRSEGHSKYFGPSLVMLFEDSTILWTDLSSLLCKYWGIIQAPPPRCKNLSYFS